MPRRNSSRKKALQNTLVALIWLGIWAVAAACVGQTLLLPSPAAVASSLWDLAQRGAFWLSALLSVWRVFLGFALGVLLGAVIAVITSWSEAGRAFFAPFLAAVKATPVASFILLALVWIRTDGVPVFATVLVVLPLVWANVSAGIHAVDPLLLEMAKAYRMRGRDILARLYWPTVRPYFRAAIATGMGMAWKAGVAAEVICTPRNALGTWLYSAKIYLDMPGLFAATAVVILLSVLLEKVVVRAVSGGGRRRGHV